MTTDAREVLIDIENLRVEFRVRGSRPFVAVRDVSFQIYKGETFGLVGETGSGKTTIGRAIIRINETAAGTIKFRGQQINNSLQGSRPYGDPENPDDLPRPHVSLNERAKVDYIVSGMYNTKNYKDE